MVHLNINGIKGKFQSLQQIVRGNIDILAISESKLGHEHNANSLDMDGYTQPFRRDRDARGGGILVYVKGGITCRELKMKSEDIEGLCLEINLRKNKWLFLLVITIIRQILEPFYSA